MERFLKDWRVKTLAPVIAIHLVAFFGVYWVIYRLVLEEAVRTHRYGAELRLRELAQTFRFFMRTQRKHPLTDLEKLTVFARSHRASGIAIYDAKGNLKLACAPAPSQEDQQEARRLVEAPETEERWHTDRSPGLSLTGFRTLPNGPLCQQCHPTSASILGVIQVSTDLSEVMDQTGWRLRFQIGGLLLVWLLLVAAVNRVRAVVIDEPIERMKQILDRARKGSDAKPQSPRDLSSLASELDRTIWSILERQRVRESEISRQMARAEQLASLGELASGLAHEIKNPISGVSAAIEVLKLENKHSAGNPIYDEIKHELDRVVATVDGLLRLARPRPPSLSRVDMKALVLEVVDLFMPRLKNRPVTLAVDAADGLPILSLDPNLMTQLLLNLLTNSLQAMTEGSIKVSLASFPNRDGLVLSVVDTGPGIPRENLERVMEPFFTTKEHGTGLGLAICRQIVEAHGGSITIESEPGKGTAVVILLPGTKTLPANDEK